MSTRTSLFLALVLACGAMASEGDLLLETGVAAVGRTVQNHSFPGLGASAAVLSGFNDRTDIGLAASWDHLNGKNGAGDLDVSTVAIQSWFTAYTGDIRPQVGGAVGVSVDGETNASLHLAARARAVMELSTKFRLFAGAAVGGDIGDEGSSFVRGEFGAQFLLK